MSDITEGIRDYLASGGLFNPELMDHQRVRDLVIECRDEIEQLRELLREVIGCGVSYRARDYSEVQIPHVLNDAIREALGEGDE